MWHTGVPPKDGWYLVTVEWMGRRLVFTDRWEEPIGFVEHHDCVLAWQEVPEPYKGEKNADK